MFSIVTVELTNWSQDDVVSKPFRIPDLIPKIEYLDARYRAGGPSDDEYEYSDG